MKITILLLTLSLSLISCGESNEQIELETAKIIVAQNNALSEYNSSLQDVAMLNLTYDMNREMPGWQQRAYDDAVDKYQINKLVEDFKLKFGDDQGNLLSIKMRNNFNSQIK